VVGVALGVVVGRLLAQLAFRAKQASLRLAEIGEPLLALAAVLLAYGVAEVCGGYGFLAVFACAMTLRAAERGSDYHAHMHESIERLERLLTLIVLLLLGIALTDSLLEALTWQGAIVGVALVFVIRPVSGLVALRPGSGRKRIGDASLNRAEQNATAFFGVRGVGALYYMAYATGEVDLPLAEQLWATVAFAIAVSVLVHGVTATPVMRRLEDSTA
jgi:NhaP-type Na+/H+ or K+/H+ antiporter